MQKQSTSIYKSFCKELAQCVRDQDMDGYKTVYKIARKSAPSCFSKENKTKYESDIFQLLLNRV